jgi:hypothetical protein
MLIDSDESYTYHSRASGRRGLVRVARSTGRAELMIARGRFSAAVPPRAAAEGSIAESVIHAHHRDDAGDFAELPPSPWPTPAMRPWRPPTPTMNSDDYAPMREIDWTKPRPATSTKPAPAAADSAGVDYAPMKPSPWDR